MKVLAIVPARCGSKGFVDKNIATINGKTLLELAVNVGVDCPLVDDVYVSTDSVKYEQIALDAGAKSLGMRPVELAGDKVKSVDVVLDLINRLEAEYDYLVLLQSTSPIRQPEDITKMVEICEQQAVDAVVSVAPFEEPHPYKLKVIDEQGAVAPFITSSSSEVPRQELPKVYALNGAIYVIRVESLLNSQSFFPENTFSYIMTHCINIDSEEDFIFLKAMYENNKITIYGI